MDGNRFDDLTRAVAATSKTRRGLLGSAVALAAAVVGARTGLATEVCPPGQTPNNKG